MGSIDQFTCGCLGSGGLERVRYFSRQLITADDMRAEQDYFREKLRRHNRFLHGWGVVTGLQVQPNSARSPLSLSICPGYALGPWGDEIYVAVAEPFDLTPAVQQLAQPSCANPGVSAAALASGKLSIQIRYAECQTRPVRILPAGCGCDDAACEFSRIRDGYEIRAVPYDDTGKDTEVTHVEVGAPQSVPALMKPPTSDWIELAVVTLPTGEAGAVSITAKDIDNTVRRVLA